MGAHFLYSSGGRLHHYMTTLACLAGGQSFVHLGESCYLFIYLSFFFGWGGGGGVVLRLHKSLVNASSHSGYADMLNSLIPLEFRH